MNEVLNFLNECGVFFVSTVDGNQPKVRPFNFVMDYNGKLCFGTNNKKLVYSQLTANPNIEISAITKDLRWIRLSGKAVFCTTKDTKAKALDTMPMLEQWYSVDDDILEIFYLENAVATFCSINGDNKTVNP